jgi:hypothetical protein
VQDKVRRGRQRLRRVAPERNECLEFWRGNQYVFRASTGTLASQSTTTGDLSRVGLGHRIRQSRNMIQPIVRREVSAATQRVPSYDVVPSTSDPKDVSAAKTAEKVAVFGYDDWGIKDATTKVATFAIVADEGFAWPYFDPTIPPWIDEKAGIGVGNIRVRTFGPNEVFWEPGVKFEDSRWYAIDQARRSRRRRRFPGSSAASLSRTQRSARRSAIRSAARANRTL